MVICLNKMLQIFWEVWRNAQPFKAKIMQTIYVALNKNRPKFLSEIIIKSIEQLGPAP